jgi:hypothetical protein
MIPFSRPTTNMLPTRRTLAGLFALSAVVAAGCGGKDTRPAPVPPSAAAQALLTSTDPGAALSVRDAKQKAEGERLVVRGRIAERVPGFVVLTLMDTALPYCGEVNPEDNCKTPWDYCCESGDTRRQHALLVEARGQDQQPIASPSLPGLDLLDVAKVTGTLQKDQHGNLVLVAESLFRESRPELPADLRWPQ